MIKICPNYKVKQHVYCRKLFMKFYSLIQTIEFLLDLHVSQSCQVQSDQRLRGVHQEYEVLPIFLVINPQYTDRTSRDF